MFYERDCHTCFYPDFTSDLNRRTSNSVVCRYVSSQSVQMGPYEVITLIWFRENFLCRTLDYISQLLSLYELLRNV
jgi:hypothetical protein